jgi:hypothetical protein
MHGIHKLRKVPRLLGPAVAAVAEEARRQAAEEVVVAGAGRQWLVTT